MEFISHTNSTISVSPTTSSSPTSTPLLWHDDKMMIRLQALLCSQTTSTTVRVYIAGWVAPSKKLLSFFSKRRADNTPDAHHSQHASSSSQIARTVGGEETLALLPPTPDPATWSQWDTMRWAKLPVEAWKTKHAGVSPLMYAIPGKAVTLEPGRLARSGEKGARYILRLEWILAMMAEWFPYVDTEKLWTAWVREYSSRVPPMYLVYD